MLFTEMVRLPRLSPLLAAFALLAGRCAAFEYNTFDGPGFPSCHNVVEVHDATSVDDIASLVRAAAAAGRQVRAAGKGHQWYDTHCSDDPTVLVRTEAVNAIYDFDLAAGSVTLGPGVTFFQLADYLHERGASLGYALVNWNISLGGSIAMGAHRSSLREPSMVAAGALALDIVDGTGALRRVERGTGGDDWLAASTSLGLLGVIAAVKMRIYPDAQVYAMQATLDEEAVLGGDIYGLIAPYATANLWWWPNQRKFHHRYYDEVPAGTSTQRGFQNTFSVTAAEAAAARALLDAGKLLPASNALAEAVFFHLWSAPNFRDLATGRVVDAWPVYGAHHDVLIGGLYPDQQPEWELGLHGLTLELAVPVTQANAVLRRVRALFDAEAARGRVMTSTYRSGINIKFGSPYFDLLGQATYNTSDGADWSKGVMMFDFPSFRPTYGDHKRFNEEFCAYSRLFRAHSTGRGLC